MRCIPRATGWLGALCLLAVAPATAGEIAGRVHLGVGGLPLAAVMPVVVYLEALDGTDPGGPPPQVASMHQRRARFSPRFLVVTAGQSVEMANDDAIYHNVFSYSQPNDFDLGLYPAGESRSLVLRHPGVVKIYCAIHESMNASILVAPTPWHDAVDPDGGYALRDVPAGRYRAVVWTERLPAATREIVVPGSGTRRVDWEIGKPYSEESSDESSANARPQTPASSAGGSAAAIR